LQIYEQDKFPILITLNHEVNVLKIKINRKVSLFFIALIVFGVTIVYSQTSNNKKSEISGENKINAFRLPVDIEISLQEMVKKELCVGDTISMKLHFAKTKFSEESVRPDSLTNISIDYDENILEQIDSDAGAAVRKLKANLNRGIFPNLALKFKVINCGYTKVLIGVTDLISLDANIASFPIAIKCERVFKKTVEMPDPSVVHNNPVPQKLLGF
jgi:hypothetical protein